MPVIVFLMETSARGRRVLNSRYMDLVDAEGRAWLDQTGPKGSTFKFTVRAAPATGTVTTGEQAKSNEPD